MNSLYRDKHVVSANDFSRESLERLFSETTTLKKQYQNPQTRKALAGRLKKNGGPLRFRLLFEGASTRTSSSFEDAIETLGGIAKKDVLQFSSRAKGETLRSITRILAPRCDGIIIRDDKDLDAAKKVADTVEEYGLQTIVINAGDGSREHPTQMLLDIYTICEERKENFLKGNLTYAMVGDIKDSRTIHSLLLGLSQFGGTVYLVSSPGEELPEWLQGELEKTPLVMKRTDDPMTCAPEIDVWYFTRLQQNLKTEELSKDTEKNYATKYGASEKTRAAMKKDCIALHPLPHGPEYDEGIDLVDPRFIHFKQADNGFYTRMVLLCLLFGNSN